MAVVTELKAIKARAAAVTCTFLKTGMTGTAIRKARFSIPCGHSGSLMSWVTGALTGTAEV